MRQQINMATTSHDNKSQETHVWKNKNAYEEDVGLSLGEVHREVNAGGRALRTVDEVGG